MQMLFLGGGTATPCASSPPRLSIFSDFSFLVHHPVNQDDRHLIARAIASDFTVEWQYFHLMPMVSVGGASVAGPRAAADTRLPRHGHRHQLRRG
jgi:hypothetical protein